MTPEVGEWYLSVKCHKCNCEVLVFHDLNHGHGSVNGQYVVTCPRCKDTKLRDINHYQYREEKRPDTCLEILDFR
jgi:phage FluMu protein Com